MDDIKAPQMQPEMAGPDSDMPEDDNKPEETPEEPTSAPDPEPAKKDKSGKKKKLLILLLVLLLLASGGAAAYYFFFMKDEETTEQAVDAEPVVEEEEAKTIVAFIRDGNLWVDVDGTETQLSKDAVEKLDNTAVPAMYTTVGYSEPKLSPDGTKVLYVKTEVNPGDFAIKSRTLNFIEIEGEKITEVRNAGSGADVTADWIDDETIGYSVNKNTGDSYVFSTYTLDPAKSKEVGTYTITSGCGGAISDAADAFWRDTAFFNSIAFGLGQVGNDTLYHHGNCANNGIYAFDLVTGKDTAVSKSVQYGALSPDGKTIATVTTGGANNKKGTLLLVNTSDGKTASSITTESRPVDVAWSSDGKTILFTTVASDETKEVDEDQDDVTTPNQYSFNTVTLWQMDVATEKITKVVDLDIHALDIKAAVVDDDGKIMIYGGAVENATDLVDFIDGGGKPAKYAEHLPQVNLMEIDVDKQAWEITINDAEQADVVATE